MRNPNPTLADSCWRTSLAAVLEVPLSEVPSYGEIAHDDHWDRRYDDWLLSRFGLRLAWIPFCPRENCCPPPMGHSILVVKCPREEGTHGRQTPYETHAVACMDGRVVVDTTGQMAYDRSDCKWWIVLYAPNPTRMARLESAVRVFIERRGRHDGNHEFCCNNGRCLGCEQSYIAAEAELDAVLKGAAG